MAWCHHAVLPPRQRYVGLSKPFSGSSRERILIAPVEVVRVWRVVFSGNVVSETIDVGIRSVLLEGGRDHWPFVGREIVCISRGDE